MSRACEGSPRRGAGRVPAGSARCFPFARVAHAVRDAKLATEALLVASPMHEVIVRPEAYQEPRLSAERRLDWRTGAVMILTGLPSWGRARLQQGIPALKAARWLAHVGTRPLPSYC